MTKPWFSSEGLEPPACQRPGKTSGRPRRRPLAASNRWWDGVGNLGPWAAPSFHGRPDKFSGDGAGGLTRGHKGAGGPEGLASCPPPPIGGLTSERWRISWPWRRASRARSKAGPGRGAGGPKAAAAARLPGRRLNRSVTIIAHR